MTIINNTLFGLPTIDEETLCTAGVENEGSWCTENGQAMRAFSGGYTIGEVKALLADMERVQEQLDIAALARIDSQKAVPSDMQLVCRIRDAFGAAIRHSSKRTKKAKRIEAYRTLIACDFPHLGADALARRMGWDDMDDALSR
jgi:hypothetical protein